MKKVFLTLMLVGLFGLIPTKTMAMVKVDENGNAIATTPSPDGVTTLMIDEGASVEGSTGQGSDGSTTVPPEKRDIPPTTGDNASVSSDDAIDGAVILNDNNNDAKDLMYTTGVTENNILAEKQDEKNENKSSVLMTVLVGIASMSFGSVATLLILKRK